MNKKSKSKAVDGALHVILSSSDLQKIKRLKALKTQLRALTETVKREQDSLIDGLPVNDDENILVDGNGKQVATYKLSYRDGFYVKPSSSMRLTLQRTNS